MRQVVLLDAHPLSQVTHPKIKPEVIKWMQFLRDNNIAFKAPEISAYEIRRELIRQNNNKSLERLNLFINYSLIPINSETFIQDEGAVNYPLHPLSHPLPNAQKLLPPEQVCLPWARCCRQHSN